jgi:peptidyl-prolyl cis-trans isomerase C
MKRTVIRGLFFVLAGAYLASCQRLTHGLSGSDSPVVAQVGDNKITLDDLKARLQETPAAYQQYIASAEGRRQFLNLLIREKVLLSEAKSLGISRDPAYQTAVEKYKNDSKRRLQEYEETLQVESALRRLRATDLAVTDTEVDKYYTDHRDEYDKPVEILASHILVSSEQDAQTALARIKSGEPFEKVAREMSKDPATAIHGGKLTPFHRGMLPPEFEDAAFALKPGELSGIVKTQFGFHIIKILGEKQLPARSGADIKEDVRSKLERDKFNQWVAAKQATLGVKVDDQAMAALSSEESSKP